MSLSIKEKMKSLQESCRSKDEELRNKSSGYSKITGVVRKKEGGIAFSRIGAVLILLLVLIIMPGACSSLSKNKLVNRIKNSPLPPYSETVSLDTAFSHSLFSNRDWSYLEQDKETGIHYIQLGVDLYLEDEGESARIYVIFEVSKDKKRFDVENMYFSDGEQMNAFTALSIMLEAYPEAKDRFE